MKKQNWILVIIILSQFMCTSLWFAGNVVMPDLIKILNLEANDLGDIISSVQFGFIIGTLVYSFYTIADRFNPSIVFLISALLGAISNVLIAIEGIGFLELILSRFFTGFFLAGIYPVGMKIASDYYEHGLGKALSFLVAALVLGTGLPHLLASMDATFDWKLVLYATSGLATLGGLLILLFVGEGPYRKQGQKIRFSSVFSVFKNKKFNAAALGYFGHMWELYAFWVFVPLVITSYSFTYHLDLNHSLISFLVIGLGGVACVFGGILSQRFGSKKVALIALSLSGLCCLVSPLMFTASPYMFIAFLVFWGWVVIVDSPLFSALVAKHAEPELKGTALTIVTSIGFAISIVSIQLVGQLYPIFPFENLFLILTIGPAIGVFGLIRSS